MYYSVGSGIEIQLELKFLQYMCQIHVLVVPSFNAIGTSLPSFNAIGTSLTSFNAIGTSLGLFRQAEKPLGPLRQVEKKLSQLDRKDRAMFRLLSTVSLKTNARLPNTKQACLNSDVISAGFDLTTIPPTCK